MKLWRRRIQSASPVVLPSLDRLAGLIDRVVELVDAVAVTPVPAPEPVPEPPREGQLEASPDSRPTGWIAFVSSPTGYRIVDRDGVLPSRGETMELEDGRYVVLRHGPSPLPGDTRSCAYLAREEPPEPERSLDA